MKAFVFILLVILVAGTTTSALSASNDVPPPSTTEKLPASGKPASASMRLGTPFLCGNKRIDYSEEISCKLLNTYTEISKRERSSEDSTSKKVVTSSAYDRWASIVVPLLSMDGSWVAYTESLPHGTADLVIRSVRTKVEYRVGRGVIPRSNSFDDWRERQFRPQRVWPTQISADSRYIVFLTSKDHHESDSEKPRSLGVIDLLGGEMTVIPGVIEFSLSGDSGAYVAYIKKDRMESSGRPPQIGRTLVLRNLHEGAETEIHDIGEYVLDTKGTYLAYTVESKDERYNGVYVRRLSDGNTKALLSGPGNYQNLVVDPVGQKFAFISNHKGFGMEDPPYSVYYVGRPFSKFPDAIKIEPPQRNEAIHVANGLSFTKSGTALVFGVQPRSGEGLTSQPAKTPNVELWTWKDVGHPFKGRPESQRRVRAVLYHLQQRDSIELNEGRNLVISNDAKHAIGVDSQPYKMRNMWAWPTVDLYWVDAVSGRSEMFREGVEPLSIPTSTGGFASISPGGQYAIYFENDRWWSFDFNDKKVTDLTGSLLDVEDFEVPHSWVAGIAGWTEGDHRLLLYGQRDIWEIDPSGEQVPRRITHGIGEKQNIVFRLLKDAELANEFPGGNGSFSSEDAPINPRDPILLIGVDRDTMESSIWRLWFGQIKSLKKVFNANKRITPIASSQNIHLFTMETFRDFPDLWVSSFTDESEEPERISNSNPQQDEYNWGSGELVEFRSDFGATLKGRLYKPDNFDPSKKYPMVVSIYQSHSGALNRYASPKPLAAAMTGTHNWPDIVSAGYLYFVPDIVSASPYPMQSAFSAVVPGVRSIVDKGFVDESRICLTGHSAGGWEASFIITQTNLFKCAVIGAPPVDMVSFYGTRSTGTGMRDLEVGWGMQGGTVWKNPFHYIVNSSIFYADRVNAPVLIMHNDSDHGVPFSQGVSLFNALRRNKKEAYLVNYSGEDHSLYNYENRLDWDRRVHEFFDYFLKDAPRPAWMSYANVKSSPKPRPN